MARISMKQVVHYGVHLFAIVDVVLTTVLLSHLVFTSRLKPTTLESTTKAINEDVGGVVVHPEEFPQADDPSFMKELTLQRDGLLVTHRDVRKKVRRSGKGSSSSITCTCVDPTFIEDLPPPCVPLYEPTPTPTEEKPIPSSSSSGKMMKLDYSGKMIPSSSQRELVFTDAYLLNG